jgi:diphosphomevalonate decarboxylase
MKATALAHPNIALAKYWGKRDDGHNLPAVPSLSVTLEGMVTRTTVEFIDGLAVDELRLQGAPASSTRIEGLLDRVRRRAGSMRRARVESTNDFPTASGLASSASAFAALAVAATHAAGLALSPDELSDLARQSSVSSARSVLGGFVALRAGREGEEHLSAEAVAPADHLDLRVVVAVTHEGPKAIGSSEGMRHTVRTSPYFAAWVAHAPSLYARIREALLRRDLEALGAAAEQSALAMHASAIAAAPGLLYWSGATVDALTQVRALRGRGLSAWATIDAGPHVKVLTTSTDEARVAEAMREVPGVLRTIEARPGPGAHLDEERTA